ncbi:MAG: hypothetical protein ACP5HQ_03250 [Thermoprotei archaeon]
MNPEEREDLFNTYNNNYYASDIYPILQKTIVEKGEDAKILVIGPPRGGKSFLITGKLKDLPHVYETITGFENLKPAKPNERREIAGEKKDEVGQIMKIFSGVKRLIGLGLVDVRNTAIEGFTEEEMRTLREYLGGVEKLPKELVNHLKELRKSYDAVVFYAIPWDIDENSLPDDVRASVKLMKDHFKKPTEWLGKKYVLPGFVKEIISEAREANCEKVEGCKAAEDFVIEQAEAYESLLKFLVGEKDVEFEGFLILSVKSLFEDLTKESLKKLADVAIGRLGGIVLSAVATAIFLSLIYKLTEREEGSVKELIVFGEKWRKLSDELKKLIASKVALQLGITPEDALEAINEVTGLDVEQLEKAFEGLRKEIKGLKERLDRLENVMKTQNIVSSLYTEPSQLHIEFKDGKTWIKFGNLSYKFVDPEGFPNLKDKVANVVKKVREAVDGGKILIVRGPHGVGKSTFINYLMAKMLKEGEIKGIIDLAALNEGQIHSTIEEAIGFKRYVLLYDPSTLLFYEVGGLGRPKQEVARAIVSKVEKIFNLMTSGKDGVTYSVPTIIVIPDDVYNVLREDARKRVESVEFNVSDMDFLKEIIRSYSGCMFDENTLSNLVSEVLKFKEGYTLIARLVGENLKEKGCNVSRIEELLRESRGRADLFLVWWINDYLKIKEDNEINTQRVEAFSEILAIREPLKDAVKSGMYVMPPYFVNRLARWSNGLNLGGKKENWGEEAHWLALKHEDLLEDAISLIVRAVRGEEIKDKQLREVLSVWMDQEKRVRVNSMEEAVKYVFKEYGGKIKEVIAGEGGLADPNSPCWNALVFALGAVRGGHGLRLPLIAYKRMSDEGKRDLAEPVRRALNFLSDPESECRALDMLLADGELTPLSEGLLLMPYSAEKLVDNPFIDVMVQRDRMKGELEALLKKWEERQKVHLLEEIYGLGLSILSAYAKVDFADEALRVASLSIDTVTRPNLIVSAVDLLSSLRGKSPDRWAEFISSAINVVADIKEALLGIGRFVMDSLEDLDKLRDSNKVRLVHALASLIGGGAPPNVVCETAKLLLKVAEGLGSEFLRYASEARVLEVLTKTGLNCGINLAREIERLISDLDRAEKFDEWLKDENVREYLKGVSLRQPKEALVSHVKNILGVLHSAAGAISLREGKFDDAVKHFEKARALAQETEHWGNYVAAHSFLVRARVLKADSLQGLIEAAGEFREVFNEAVEKLGIDARGSQLKGITLAEYLIYLGLSGNKGEAEGLLKVLGWLLDYLPLAMRVATTLLLNYLGVVDRRPGVDEVLGAARVLRFMAPALKLSLGLDVDCGKGCEELYEGEPDEKATLCEHVCNGLRLALKGNRFAREMLVEDLKSVSEGSVVEELSKEFSPRAVIQALSTDRSVGDLILTLNALLDGDRETVRAISKGSELIHSNIDIVSGLFKALREAVENNDEERVKLALAKLYYLHF